MQRWEPYRRQTLQIVDRQVANCIQNKPENRIGSHIRRIFMFTTKQKCHNENADACIFWHKSKDTFLQCLKIYACASVKCNHCNYPLTSFLVCFSARKRKQTVFLRTLWCCIITLLWEEAQCLCWGGVGGGHLHETGDNCWFLCTQRGSSPQETHDHPTALFALWFSRNVVKVIIWKCEQCKRFFLNKALRIGICSLIIGRNHRHDQYLHINQSR